VGRAKTKALRHLGGRSANSGTRVVRRSAGSFVRVEYTVVAGWQQVEGEEMSYITQSNKNAMHQDRRGGGLNHRAYNKRRPNGHGRKSRKMLEKTVWWGPECESAAWSG
jgi:hypothetical protein